MWNASLPASRDVKFMNTDETDRYHIRGRRRKSSAHAELWRQRREMETGWYAAIIRMRIKRRLHVRVGTNLTLRIQGRILLLPLLLSTPDEARGRVASHPRQKRYATGKQNTRLLFRFMRIQPFNYLSEKVFIGIHSLMFMYLCCRVFGPHLCPCILMGAIMHVWMYGCMQQVTGQWGIEFGWWGRVMEVQSGGGLVGDGVNRNRVEDGRGSWSIKGMILVWATAVF